MLTASANEVLEVRRREFIAIVGANAAAWPLAAGAQPVGKPYLIGVLETISPTANAANLDAFRRVLRELGYVEGQNFGRDLHSLREKARAALLGLHPTQRVHLA